MSAGAVLKRSVSEESLAKYDQDIRKDATAAVSDTLAKLLAMVPPEKRDMAAENFRNYNALFDKYISEVGKTIDWDAIKPPKPGMIKPHHELPEVSEDPALAAELLSQLAVLKLNGGLGTSMGCVGPKSAIAVRRDLTFLDLVVRQIESLNDTHGVDVPLVLMNSFNTHDDTEDILRKYVGKKVEIKTFNQSRMPIILKDTLTPLPRVFNNNKEWYPPGHGDLYRSLHSSGTLDNLLEQGKKWLFVSNIDNLGATVDLKILQYVVKTNPDCEFIMEVTDKTRADIKGGTLVEADGNIRLLEVAQVPKEYLEEFKSVNRFRVFNTNNLWINLEAMKRLIDSDSISMEVIENKKMRDGRLTIQLEQAVGTAIKNFKGACGINVSRSRFLPVKKTSDLLLVLSNLYTLSRGRLTMNPKRIFQNVPLIKLGDASFKTVSQFTRRFENIPDILELDHLTVMGDVMFGKNVTLRGTVIIIANEGERIDIPAGAILENKIVTGNLRIMEH